MLTVGMCRSNNVDREDIFWRAQRRLGKRRRRAPCHPELDMAASDNSIGAVIGLLIRF
jgi:hypothetical protein